MRRFLDRTMYKAFPWLLCAAMILSMFPGWTVQADFEAAEIAAVDVASDLGGEYLSEADVAAESDEAADVPEDEFNGGSDEPVAGIFDDDDDEGRELCCGFVEHIHDESCYTYVSVLVCGYEENVEDQGDIGMSDFPESEENEDGLTGEDEIDEDDPAVVADDGSEAVFDIADNSEIDEAVEDGDVYTVVYSESFETGPDGDQEEEAYAHEHTDACYELQKVLVCGKEAHEHTDACFGNALMTLTDCDYVLAIRNAVVGREDVSDVFRFVIAVPSGVTAAESEIEICGDGYGAFMLFFDAAGRYTVTVECITPDDGSFYHDARTLTVTFDVSGTRASGYTVTEVSRVWTFDGAETGTQSAFVVRYKPESSWSDTAMERARDIMSGMTLEEKVGQMFLVHYPGNGSGTAAEATSLIKKYHPGGFLVFGAMFNGATPASVIAKTTSAQVDALLDTGIPMMFSVDEEGGSVVRVSSYSAFRSSKFASQMDVAKGGTAAVEADAVEKAALLTSLGLTVNHAPDADVSGPAGYIYDRTYGGDGLYNGQFVAAAIRGHEENGVATTMKHFPGYGGTSANTHNGFAINNLPLSDFEYNDLLPFYAGIGAGGKAVMVTHNIINCMDAEMPASLSSGVISYLRDEMGFDGIVMTDDLNMKAVTLAVGDGYASLAAIKAGVDMPMTEWPEKDIPVVLQAIENGELSESRIEESCLRVLCWKIEMGLIDLEVDPDIPPVEEVEARWLSEDGSEMETGTFNDMWEKGAANGGVVTLLSDVATVGDRVVNKNLILNLNGHKLNITSGTHGFTVTGGAGIRFEIADTCEPEVFATVSPESLEPAGWNSVRNELVYYTFDGDGVKTRHDVSFDACGAVTGNTGGSLIYLDGASFRLSGGRLTANGQRGIETSASTANAIGIRGGIVAGCGGSGINNGGGIYVNKGGLFIYDGYIAGNTAADRGGGAYVADAAGTVSMSGGVVAANNSGGYGAGISLFTNNTLTMSGGTVASNTSRSWCGGVYAANGCTVKIQKTTHITDNTGTDGAGIYVFGVNSKLNIENGLISGNRAVKTGGGVNMQNGAFSLGGGTIAYNEAGESGGGLELDNLRSCSICNGDVHNNAAGMTGGGISFMGSTRLYMSQSSVMNNTAGVSGGGIYHGGAGMHFVDGLIQIKANKVDSEPNNLYLSRGRTVALSSVLTANSTIRIYTEVLPEDGAPVDVATSSDSLYLSNCKTMFKSDRKDYSIVMPGDKLILAVGSGSHEGTDLDFEGILFQYYGTVMSPSALGEPSRALTIIDTSGRILPTNNNTGSNTRTKHLYLDGDGSVKMDSVLMSVYKSEDIPVENIRPLDELSKFTGEAKYYTVTELWVADSGDYTLSIDPADWTVYPWSEDLYVTTDEGDTDGNAIYVDEGSVVRFVAVPAAGDADVNAIFYDYDISDGMVYRDREDARQRVSGLPTSSQETMGVAWVNCFESGINNIQNYAESDKARLAFGNANMGTGLDTVQTGNFYINRYNRPVFQGCSFGIVEGIGTDGRLIYNSSISAPNLFDDGDAIGKTVIGGHKLEFIQGGYGYTLESVSGTNVSNLSWFRNPGIYDGVQNKTCIWSNDFWPLDDMGTFGADGHDYKFGSQELTGSRLKYQAGEASNTVVSDDGEDHNSYFGMQFALDFILDEDYVGPMEYYFFGDDDMWVFLDDQLVSDIGGIHSSVGSFVNLWDYLEEGEGGLHTLKFYYMERGAGGSTCWMHLNVPHIMDATSRVVNFPGSLRIEKSVEGIDTDEEFEFTLTLDLSDAEGTNLSDTFTYIGSKSGTIKSGDTFTLRDGEYIIVQNLPEGTRYSVREAEYRDFAVTSVNAEGTIVHGASRADFVNTYRPFVPRMPDAGGVGVNSTYGMGAALMMCSILAFLHRKRKIK